MASLSPASPPSLASLPAEVLARCLSGGRAELLALSSTCRALRTTLDDPRAAALRPLWAAVVLAVADPAASLALADRPAPVSPDPPFLSDAEVRAARVGSMYPSFVARHHGINVVSYDEELLRGDATYLGPDASFSPQSLRGAGSGAAALAAQAARRAALDATRDAPSEAEAFAASSFSRHAARAGGWRPLLRSLTARSCAACGAATSSVAWPSF